MPTQTHGLCRMQWMSKAPKTSTQAALPSMRSLRALRGAARHCQACPLYLKATQTVFGEGPAKARIVLVGEQPGDKEDVEGHPFVGPAGQLLRRALASAEIPEKSVYLTNTVKHFKWEPRGKRRLHAKPSSREIMACRPWLEAELRLIRPEFLVCLGATAARSVCGRPVKIAVERGHFFATEWSQHTLVSMHPSALLRLREHEEREAAFVSLVADLRLIFKRMGAG
jgi:uracil-DNA glycosylase family protein